VRWTEDEASTRIWGFGSRYKEQLAVLAGMVSHLRECSGVLSADVAAVENRYVIQLVQCEDCPEAAGESGGQVHIPELMERVSERLGCSTWQLVDNGRYQASTTGMWYTCLQLAWLMDNGAGRHTEAGGFRGHDVPAPGVWSQAHAARNGAA
jgi:hypothetical protein